MDSVVTGVRKGHFASFPAVRAIIQAIHAEPDVFQTLANGAVSLARALILRLVALTAKHRADRHRSLLEETLPELRALRQVGDVAREARKQWRRAKFAGSGHFFDAPRSAC